MTTPRKKVNRLTMDDVIYQAGEAFVAKMLTPEASKLIEAAIRWNKEIGRSFVGFPKGRVSGDLARAIDLYLHSQKGKNGKG